MIDIFSKNFHVTDDPNIFILSIPNLTVCGRSLISKSRAVLVDFVLRTDAMLTSLGPDTILGMVFDLTKRYSSPECLLLFLNVPHNIFAMSRRSD